MVEFAPWTPEEIAIRDTFINNLLYLVDRYSEQDKASRHGESDPEFARIIGQLTQLTAETNPEAVAIFFQAMFAAAIATVRHYQQEGK